MWPIRHFRILKWWSWRLMWLQLHLLMALNVSNGTFSGWNTGWCNAPLNQDIPTPWWSSFSRWRCRTWTQFQKKSHFIVLGLFHVTENCLKGNTCTPLILQTRREAIYKNFWIKQGRVKKLKDLLMRWSTQVAAWQYSKIERM